MIIILQNEETNRSKIKDYLTNYTDWKYNDNELETSLEFESFKDFFSIMTRITFKFRITK